MDTQEAYKEIINQFVTFGIIIAIIGLFFKILGEYIKSIKKKKKSQNNNEQTEQMTTMPYVEKFLLSTYEYNLYRELKSFANKYKMYVLAKVRLADIVEVKNANSPKERTIVQNKINSKHIDFLLADPNNLMTILAIELDDKSHEKEERKARDNFVDEVFETARIKILHIKDINDVESQICKKLNIEIKQTSLVE